MAFEARLAADRKNRIPGGQQLLADKNVHPSAARQALLAGQVDPWLLVTLSALAHEMPLELVASDDSSPGVRSDVPLRGAENRRRRRGGPAGDDRVPESQRTRSSPGRHR